MRVNVIGENPTASALRGLLSRADIHVTSFACTLTITIDESFTSTFIVVDGVDGELERRVVEHICDLADGVYLARRGGVRSASALRITTPRLEESRRAVEVGCLRGILAYVNRKPWWKIW